MTGPAEWRLGAIVFDLDDTLYPQVEFTRSGFSAVAEWSQRNGIGAADRVVAVLDELLRSHGAVHPRLFDLAIERLGISPGVLPVWIEVFRGHAAAIEPYPGVAAMLQGLAGRYRLGLLTDGLASVQRGKVAALGFGGSFAHLVFSDERSTCKPDVRLYAEFEREFALPPDALLYVGDNPDKDFLGARARGWQTLRVLTGTHAQRTPPSSAHAAAFEIAAVTDLPRLLGQAGVRASAPGSGSGSL